MFESTTKAKDFLNIYFKIGGLLGLYPILMNRKYLFWIHILEQIIFYIVSGYQMFKFLKHKSIISFEINIQNFIPLVTNLIYWGANFLFLYQMVKNRTSWKILFKCLSSIENNIEHGELKIKKPIIRFGSFIILSLVFCYYTTRFLNTYTFRDIMNIIQWILVHLQLLTIFFSVVELCTKFTKTNHYLRCQICSQFSMSRNIITRDNLNHIKFIHSNIYIAADQFKDIFGALMIVFFLLACFLLLVMTNWIVLLIISNVTNLMKNLIINSFPVAIVLFVSIISSIRKYNY